MDNYTSNPDRPPASGAVAVVSPPSTSAIRGGATRVLGYAVGVLVSLGTAAILVRHLGIAGFGRYVTVTSLVALVGGVTEAGIVVYGIREFMVGSEPERRRLVGNLLAMRLALVLIGIGFAVTFSLAIGYKRVIVLGTLIAGAGLLGQVVTDVLSIPLQAKLLLGRLTAVEVSRRVLTLLLVALLATAGANLLGMLAASSVATFLALALITWLVRSLLAVQLRIDRRFWRQLFAETLPYAIALSIAAVYVYVTVIVVSLISSATQTGLFATSFRVIAAVLAIPTMLLTAIFPLMLRTRSEHAGELGPAVGRVFTVAVICGVWMSLAIVLGANVIVDLIAGRHGHGAVPVLRIQGLVLAVSFLSTSSALGLISLRRYRALMISSAAALTMDIVLSLLLVPSLGARGGAIADVVTEAAAAAGLSLTLVRATPDHGITVALLPPLLLACTLSASVLLLPIGSVARVLCASVIYFGVLLLMRAIPREVIDAARKHPLRETGQTLECGPRAR
jgi:O-antigen/teichoic acid export membrane protein